MKVVVTGGAGFIGSSFVRGVLGGAYPDLADARVVVLDKLTYAGSTANLAPVADSPRLTFVRGDVCDAALVADVVRDADAVVHLAAESHVDRSIAVAADFVVTNVVGTQTVLDAARAAGVRRVLHVSTDEVYGPLAQGLWTESAALRPTSPYAASKASADLLALAAHRTHGLDVVVTRGSNTYGPYQFPEKLVPRFVLRLLAGRTVPLYGDGRQVRSWLHVEDHCRGVALALVHGRPGGVYNLGGGTELTNLELTERLLAATGRGRDAVEVVEDRKGHDRRYGVDGTKAAQTLGYAPAVQFEDGLAATVEWYRRHAGGWSVP